MAFYGQAATAAFRDTPEAIVDCNNVEGSDLMNNWVAGASIAAIALIHPASSAFAADKPVYAVLMKTLSNQFFSAAAKGVEAPRRRTSISSSLRARPASGPSPK